MELTRQPAPPTLKARKTIDFTGGANNGASGDAVTIFGITGRVQVLAYRAFCTDTLVGASATISVGVTSVVDAIIAVTTATDLATNEFWVGAAPSDVGYVDLPTAMIDFLVSEDIDANVLTQNITDGTIIFDVEYIPLTDDGLLTGD